MTKVTKVNDYTKHLADGTSVKVAGHQRSYTPGSGDDHRVSPVEDYRRERLKAQARMRREAGWEKGKEAFGRARTATRKRSRQSKRLAKRGVKLLSKSARYASRRRRVTAAACLVGGLTEVVGAVAWSGGGLVVSTVAVLGSALLGGLLLGRQQEKREGSGPTATRAGTRARRRQGLRKPAPAGAGRHGPG